MKKLFKILFLTGVAWFAVHCLFITVDGLYDEPGACDYAVILGNKVNRDGTLSERLQKRLDKGIRLYKDSLAKTIVVSGGLGKEGFYEGSEMAEYLIQRGIPEEKIIIDNLGNTTRATAINCGRIISHKKPVIIVTQYHHISRTKLAFRQEGFEEVKGAHAAYFEVRDLYSFIREFFGYYAYLLSGIRK